MRHDNSPHTVSYDIPGYTRQVEEFPDKGSADARRVELENLPSVSNLAVVLSSDPQPQSVVTASTEDTTQPSTNINISISVELTNPVVEDTTSDY